MRNLYVSYKYLAEANYFGVVTAVFETQTIHISNDIHHFKALGIDHNQSRTHAMSSAVCVCVQTVQVDAVKMKDTTRKELPTQHQKAKQLTHEGRRNWLLGFDQSLIRHRPRVEADHSSSLTPRIARKSFLQLESQINDKIQSDSSVFSLNTLYIPKVLDAFECRAFVAVLNLVCAGRDAQS